MEDDKNNEINVLWEEDDSTVSPKFKYLCNYIKLFDGLESFEEVLNYFNGEDVNIYDLGEDLADLINKEKIF